MDAIEKVLEVAESEGLTLEEARELAAICAPYEAILPKQRRGRSMPPRLKVGERVRLAQDGPLYRVVRVNECAAYLKPAYSEPKLVEFGSRSFMATEGGSLIAVSPYSFVYREPQS